MKMGCTGYKVERRLDDFIRVNADFIIVGTSKENVGEILKDVENLFYAGVDIVKTVPDKTRCMYCAALNELDNKMCSQCGAPL